MKKFVFLIAALLAAGTMGLAGCHTSNSTNGSNADELQPRNILTEDTDGCNEDNEDEQKPPHCEERMPHKRRQEGNRHPSPIPEHHKKR